jgi:hypothetical protein
MSPPDYPGIPSRNKLPSKPLVEVEREAVSDADTVRAFHSHGKLGISIGSNVVVAAITAGLTWLASHHGEPAVDCASKADLNAMDKHVSELSASVKDLTTSISRNADQAHNDTQNVATELHSYINSHAK